MDAPMHDRWGNLRVAPVKTIEETHDGNFVRVFIHQNDDRVFYWYQIKIGNMIKQKAANIKDTAYDSIEAARVNACRTIQNICAANRNARKLIADFDKIRYNQPTLFEED
jgi:hypothetical protein